MSTLLVKDARLLVTMDAERREIGSGGLFARDGRIEQVAPTAELPDRADRVLDLSDHLVLPGLVNTHHHLYQTLTRALPAAQDADLFDWLTTLYPIWGELRPEGLRVSTLIGCAELLLSGCTTASDHLYLFPNGCRLEDEIEAAGQIGIRFHASRGSMSLGRSQGGLPPDRLTESQEAILRDTRRVIEAFHDPDPFAMTRIVVAPCSPFSVTPDLMRESAALARSYGVRLHTHLAETLDEERFCLERFGHRPVGYAEELGWTGEDVWWAHAVHLNEAEIGLMARTRTGAAHCPSSNMRLASGIAPLGRLRQAGVRVGLGVDGSASNDGSHMLAESRQAMLLQRVSHGPGALSARQALELATLGGAAVLGRDDIGALAPGRAADFAAWRLDHLEYAGAQHDPLAALVFCAPRQADLVVVQGRIVVQGGQLLTVDLPPLIETHNRLSREMVTRAI